MSESESSPVSDYLKGYLGGLGGILASNEPIWAVMGANAADNERRQASGGGDASAGAGAGMAAIAVLIILSPPFIAPVLALVSTWRTLTDAAWHPLLIGLTDLAELTVMIMAVWMLFRYLNRIVIELIAAAYIGLSYGLTVKLLLSQPSSWALGIGLTMAVAGFFFARWLRGAVAARQSSLGDAARVCAGFYVAICAILAMLATLAAYIAAACFSAYALFRIAGDAGLDGWKQLAVSACALFVAGVAPVILVRAARRWLPWLVFALFCAAGLAAGAVVTADRVGLDAVWTTALGVVAAVGGFRLGVRWVRNDAA